MYTDNMRIAFKSLDSQCPKGFRVDIVDHEHFLAVSADEKIFMSLFDEDKRRAIEYMARVKDALERNGAIVLLVRKGGKEE